MKKKHGFEPMLFSAEVTGSIIFISVGGLMMAFCDLFKEFQPIRVDENIF